MTYDEFKATICKQIESQLPSGTSVHLQRIHKNNGLELDGLTISSPQSNVSPTIFLNYYYEKRNLFPDFDAICRDILLTYEHNKSTENLDIDFFTDYELVKDYLAYRIISFDKNKELLATVPYIRYLDFAIVFYCLLQLSDNGNATILIHSGHLKLWNVSVDELYQHTCQTTPRLLPYDLRSMGKMLEETSDGHDMDEAFCSHAKSGLRNDFCPMYLLTNSLRLYGSSCILYPHLLDKISDMLKADLFILPSSVHEMIILPATDSEKSEALANMVAEINQTVLAVDEFLSSNVYYYSRVSQTLRICT